MPPESDGKEEAESGRTVACRLTPEFARGQEAVNKIEEYVLRVNRVVFYATEAISLLVLEDIERGKKGDSLLNIGHHGVVNAMFNGVVDGRGAKQGTETHLAQERVRDAFRRIHGESHALVPGFGMAQLLKSESLHYIATVKTSLRLHYWKRVLRYVKLRLRLPHDVYKAMGKEERMAYKERVYEAVADICRPSWKKRVGENDSEFISQTRSLLGLDEMEWVKKTRMQTLSCLIKSNPHHFLPGMVAVNKALHEAGEATFRLLPMRTTLVPRFITIDQKSLKEMGLVGKTLKRKLEKDASDRRDSKRPLTERRKAILRLHGEEKRSWQEEDLKRNAGAEKKKVPVPKEEVERRNARKAEMKKELEDFDAEPEYARLMERGDEEKKDTFEAVFDVSKVLKGRDRKEWAYSLRTDGVSARLLLNPNPSKQPPGKRSRDGRMPLPKRGILSAEELSRRLLGETSPLSSDFAEVLNGLSAKEQNEVLNEKMMELGVHVTIVGGDPGKWELIVLSNPDEPKKTTRYTLKQRRNDMAPGRFFLKKKHASNIQKKERWTKAMEYREANVKPPSDVKDADNALSAFCSNGPTSSSLLSYLRGRDSTLSSQRNYYESPVRRQIRWKAFIEKQRSFSNLCEGIKKMRQQALDPNAPLVIAYGGWGLAGNCPGKGMPPCMNKGLLRKLSREFLIVVVPEHFTSKRCFHCSGECGNHLKVAEKDRREKKNESLFKKKEEKLEKCSTDDERGKVETWFNRSVAQPCEIRGLRFCSGCKRCLNRDANSAPQMGVQLKRLLFGMGPLYRLSDREKRLQTISNDVNDSED